MPLFFCLANVLIPKTVTIVRAMQAVQTNPFLWPVDEYKRQYDFIQYLKKDIVQLIHQHFPKKSIDEIAAWVHRKINDDPKLGIKDPKVTFLERQENGDRVKKESTLYRYIRDSLKKNEIIAPTLTTYISPSVKISLVSLFIAENVKRRAQAKKEQFAARGDGDKDLEIFKKQEQTAYKLGNNGVSGTHVVPNTSLYNKTSHSTLTSNCRATAGFGNANNEKFIAGNRHYWKPDLVIFNILSTLRLTQMDKIEEVLQKYDLHKPTTDEAMSCITHSTDQYWKSPEDLERIRTLVDSLSPIQRSAFVYVGDLFHLRKYNPEFVRTLLTKLSTKVTGVCENPFDLINALDGDQINQVHQICHLECAGIEKKYGELSELDLGTFALTCQHLKKTVDEHADLIQAFWTTPNAPASMGYFPESIRHTVLTGDTDSTIFTVQDYVLWLLGEQEAFGAKMYAVAGSVVYLASSTITHLLAMMSANYGVARNKLFQIGMKNEYFFPSFIPTQLGKHYVAWKSSQEGVIFTKLQEEIKGVQLKSSNSPPIIIKKGKELIHQLMNKGMRGEKFSAVEVLTYVADIEREVTRSILAGEATYLKAGSIKDAESYSQSEELSPYQRHYFWNTIFGPDYGEMPDPPYKTLKFSLSTTSATRFKAWLARLSNAGFVQRMRNWLDKNGKKDVKTIYLPTQILMEKGMPKELLEAVDIRKMVGEVCRIFYIILETLRIFVRGEKRVMRLVSDYY